MVTALLYLNTISVENGGCTVFTELGLRCASRRGRLLVFHNCRAGSKDPDPRLRHAGEPVVSGSDDKWICNKWVREAPLRARRESMMAHLYGQPAAAVSAPAAAADVDGLSFVRPGAGRRESTSTVEASSSPPQSKLLAAARAWKRQRVEIRKVPSD